MEREVITVPHPALRRKARKVTEFDDQLDALIDDMVATLRAANGVGLAAPQIDVPLRVIVVEFGDLEDESAPPELHTIVNPKITKTSQETESGVEGCLSIPGLVGEVVRPKSATIAGFDRNGEPLTIAAEGWLARIFQHEVDHLMGVLFTDHALRVWEPEEEVEGAYFAS